MKRQIRRNVFETNSSSMHSLTVMKRDDKYTPEEILDGLYLHDDKDTGEKDCVWEPWDHDMEFGRSPFRALGTFTDKWLYACASLVHEYNDDTYKELVALALKYISGLKKIKLPKDSGSIADKDDDKYKNDEYYQKHGKTEEELQEYLSQKEKDWGFEIEYWKSSNGWWHYDMPCIGYVDEDILSGFLEKEGISLEEFLINKKYVVIQDGDEYCYWDNMKQTGLVNMDMIDHEYPREEDYEEKIRKNVFETNSSSVHSLVISNDGRELSEFKLNKHGEIEVDFGQFGKDLRYYTSQYDKLSYLITCLYYLSGWEVEDIYDRYEFKEIQDAVCKYTGANGIKIIGKEEPEIDHQSQPYSGIEIIDVYNEDAVINFIFNKYVSLKTDCD